MLVRAMSGISRRPCRPRQAGAATAREVGASPRARLLLAGQKAHAGGQAPALLLRRAWRALVVLPVVVQTVVGPDEEHHERDRPEEVEDGEQRPGLDRRGVAGRTGAGGLDRG